MSGYANTFVSLADQRKQWKVDFRKQEGLEGKIVDTTGIH
jgi:hypothetical protein